ncbi:NotI family restriction endonuclease [Thioalkalivibrio sp. ALE14]|uniref:NotI family restriction endonuclease n=1 Tax=Thioalkalivibrio sp. ALE14 TaxID=1158168 RepID=UPI0009DAB343|nr:NotI family restriction endonuclease [Thioalkalivibrio sp. ALE14]
MASYIWEFFGYRANDTSHNAVQAFQAGQCPILKGDCEKRFNNGVTSGVCTIKPIKSGPVICCPVRLYSENYKILRDVTHQAFGPGFDLLPGREARSHAKKTGRPCVAVFGQRWGGELRLPQKSGRGSYFVDWVLAKLDGTGSLEEFVAVEVQSIDTTGSYRKGFDALSNGRTDEKTGAGLNWENVNKRILPQLIYKGQVLQRESLCKKGLFFVCPQPVYQRIMDRLGGQAGLVTYALQPASITFMVYSHSSDQAPQTGGVIPLTHDATHSTTVYKVQEAFNNVTLPAADVYKAAIENALDG